MEMTIDSSFLLAQIGLSDNLIFLKHVWMKQDFLVLKESPAILK